jgi:hypothetical protein
MRPLKVLAYQRKEKMDFVADCVLDLLSDFPKATTTQTIVDECSKDKVSSPATTHKKLAQLKDLGMVDDFANPHDNDGRKRYIKISAKGMKYLNGWESK